MSGNARLASAATVLYRSTKDGNNYAIKVFHKSHLLRLRVAPSETAMTDVLREVSIMKVLDHPNIVNLIEVIDDPNTDQFYMVLEYIEGKLTSEDCASTGGIGESTSRRYLQDIVAGLMYFHAHVLGKDTRGRTRGIGPDVSLSFILETSITGDDRCAVSFEEGL